jgi:ribosomal protein S18 acetylase RimI-like enzyme
MKIRPATVEDVQFLAAAAAAQPLLERYHSTAAKLEGGLRRAIEAGDGVIVVEDGDGVPRGSAWFQLDAGLGVAAYLKLITVAPGSEGRGLGSLLLAEVERIATAQGKHLFLLVSDFNVAAQRFYQRKGYVLVGRLERLVSGEIDELLYWKRLHA